MVRVKVFLHFLRKFCATPPYGNDGGGGPRGRVFCERANRRAARAGKRTLVHRAGYIREGWNARSPREAGPCVGFRGLDHLFNRHALRR